MRSRLVVVTFLLIPLLFLAPELGAQSEQVMLYAVESLGHADGTFSYRYLAYDSQTGRFSPAAPDEVPSQARLPQTLNNRFQRLLVRQSSRWARSTTQNFRVAEKAPPASRLLTKKRAFIRSVETLVHKRRGHLSIPRFKLGNAKRLVRDIRPRHPATHARDPRLEYEQFDFDNFNVYARTEDNRFFFFNPPFVTSRAIRFEFASCSFGGGVFRCPFFIVECDIYFKAGTDLNLGFFEDLPISTQKESIAGHHKFCQGHDKNTWSHDLAGTMNRDVTQ